MHNTIKRFLKQVFYVDLWKIYPFFKIDKTFQIKGYPILGNTNGLSPGIVFWLSILAEHIKNPLLCTLYPGAVYAALFYILYDIIVINVRFGFVLEVATTWGGLLFVLQGKTLSLTIRGGSFFLCCVEQVRHLSRPVH